MATKKKARRAKKSKRKQPFSEQTALFHWMLKQLGAEKWEDLPLDRLKAAEDETWTSPTAFCEVLRQRGGDKALLPDEDLERLDARVVAATEVINERRQSAPITWKYFQYLALLFTEVYLERLFTDREALRANLSAFLHTFNGERELDLPPYGRDAETDADDLDRLSFWQATGSGKTLLFHANLLQFRAAYKRAGARPPDNVLLITPNQGLSKQHLDELHKSGLRGHAFDKSRQGALALDRVDVVVVEITKFRDKAGPGTISPALFEGRNLVFVDEGHRGSSKEDGHWRKTRQALSARGFCFEYSATLAQAAAKDDIIRRDYAKSVVIDYAYRRFHADGYGKHWKVMNIRPEKAAHERLAEDANTRAYLTGALAVLAQQLLVFEESGALVVEQNLAKPFAIFVGASVTGGKSGGEIKEGKSEQTDILRVIELFARLCHPKERAANVLLFQALLDGTLGFQTRSGADIFEPSVALRELSRRKLDGAQLYSLVLDRVLNTKAPGLLHVQELKEAQGEMSLSVADGEPFAVVNVGDVAGVRKLCEDKVYRNLIAVEDKGLKGSLFSGIEIPSSTLTVLIGSRKFTEGWSSWRVSQIGLLNLGRSAGTQIVQLFGRGVRLRGKDLSLKRASAAKGYAAPGSRESRLRTLETLHVFGVRADYMDQFQEELRQAGIEEEPTETQTATLPIVRTEELPRLRIIEPPEVPFARSKERPVLAFEPNVVVTVDAYARVQQQSALGGSSVAVGKDKHPTSGPVPAFAFVNHRRLYADLVREKNRRGMVNLALPRMVERDGQELPLTRALLDTPGWFTLYAPPHLLAVSSLRHLELWQQLASELLCAYAQQLYKHKERRYTSEHARVVWLDELDEVQRKKYFPEGDEHVITVDVDEHGTDKELVAWLSALRDKVQKGELDDGTNPHLKSLGPEFHLYNPLLYRPSKAKKAIRIVCRPTALNEGEYTFVKDLQAFVDKSPALLDGLDVYLLRNEPKKGVGFFNIGGFYPDFMLWLVQRDGEHERQWLTFVDPKGLGRIADPKGWSKAQLWQTLKEIEERHPDLNVSLDAWLVSVTAQKDAPVFVFDDEKSALQHHIVFQENQNYVEQLIAGVLQPVQA